MKMNTISTPRPTVAAPRVNSPFQPATAEATRPADACSLSGASPAAAPPQLPSRGLGRTAALVLASLAGIAGAVGVAAPASAAGWGNAPATSVVQTPPANKGGWGQGTVTHPQTTQNPNGTWQTQAPQAPRPANGWDAPAPAAAPISAQPMAYSAIGPMFAQQAVTQYDTFSQWGQWQQANAGAESMLRLVADNPMSTPTEQKLAKLGLDLGSAPNMSAHDAAQGRVAVARLLAAKTDGTLSELMAQATSSTSAAISAAGNSGEPRQLADANHVLAAGLAGIAANGSTSERALAQLGLDMGAHSGVTPADALRARNAALSEIAVPSSNNFGNRLASMTHKAVEGITQWSDARAFSGDGLQAIASSPLTSEAQKGIAKLALQATQFGADEGASRLRDMNLQQLKIIQ